MASVFERDNSPFYWAKVRDSGTLMWRQVKTPFRKDSPAGKRNALVWAAAKDNVGKEDRKMGAAEAWAHWVPGWLDQTFGYNAKTLQRYHNAWKPLYQFLTEHEVPTPRQLQYRHGTEYMTWRTSQTRHRGTTINHNTAITETKVMSRILTEAQRRGYIEANPWYRLGIRRRAVKHAQPISLDEIGQHREALAKREAHLPITQRWMTVCFEIALHQGVRLTETSVPMSRIHLDARTDPAKGLNLDRVTFTMKGKNGVPKIKTVPLNPALRPLMTELKKVRATVTCVLPPMAAKEWWKFRRDNGLSHLRFHSTRSTVATQLAMNGVPIQKAMELLGHKSEAVHLAYLHFDAGDVADEIGGLSFPTPDRPGSQGEPAPTR